MQCTVSGPLQTQPESFLSTAPPTQAFSNAPQGLKRMPNAKAIPQGDGRDYCIAAASIIATVRPCDRRRHLSRDGSCVASVRSCWPCYIVTLRAAARWRHLAPCP